MKKTVKPIKALLCLCLSVALLCACQSESALSENTAAPSDSGTTTAAAGEAYLPGAAADGGLYRCSTLLPDDVTGPQHLSFVDYAASTERIVCGIAGCTHTDAACPALIEEKYENAPAEIFADGDTLFVVLTDRETQTADLYRVNADRTQRELVTGIPQTEGNGPDLFQWAADAQTLYLLLTRQAQQGKPTLYAINKADGALSEMAFPYTGRNDVAAGWYMVGARGRTLSLAHYDFSEHGAVVAGVRFFCYDLDAQTLTELANHPSQGCTETENDYGGWDGSVDACPQIETNSFTGADTAVVFSDPKNGTVDLLDAYGGESTRLAGGLPTADAAQSVVYEVTPMGDACIIRVVFTGTGENGRENELYLADGGEVLPLPQKMYVDARGTQPVYVLDIQNGTALAHYDYRSESYQQSGEFGVTYKGEEVTNLYGTIPLSDLRAGSDEFTPIIRANG